MIILGRLLINILKSNVSEGTWNSVDLKLRCLTICVRSERNERNQRSRELENPYNCMYTYILCIHLYIYIYSWDNTYINYFQSSLNKTENSLYTFNYAIPFFANLRLTCIIIEN